MKKILNYILFILLLPSLGFSQIVISGSGEIVAKGTADIVLTGDWTNNSSGTSFTASLGAGSVVFKGTSAQTVGGDEYTSFYNLNLDNPSGLSSSNFVLIQHMLFSNGIFTSTGADAVYILENGSVSGAGSGKFFNGPLAKVGDTDFQFDIGKATQYAPIKMSNLTDLSASKIMAAEYYSSKSTETVNAPLTKISDIEFWVLDDPEGTSGGVPPTDNYGTANVELIWVNASEHGIKSVDSDSLKFAKLNASSTWDAVAASITGSAGTGSGSIASTNAYKFNSLKVTFGSTHDIANPLPIQLLSFTAQCQQQDVVINWSTATEENNAYFTLLRSEDAENYEEITTVVGAGNSNNVINYSFIDRSTADVDYYYLLKQTDYDGKSESFSPIFVNCDNNEPINLSTIYDNEDIYAHLSNAKQGDRYTIVIIDMLGKSVFMQQQVVNSQNYYKLPTQAIMPGLYHIVYYNDNGSERLTTKFIKR